MGYIGKASQAMARLSILEHDHVNMRPISATGMILTASFVLELWLFASGASRAQDPSTDPFSAPVPINVPR